jgi:hypothetical protein
MRVIKNTRRTVICAIVGLFNLNILAQIHDFWNIWNIYLVTIQLTGINTLRESRGRQCHDCADRGHAVSRMRRGKRAQRGSHLHQNIPPGTRVLHSLYGL